MGIDLKKIIMINLLVIQLNEIFSIGTFIIFFTCFMFGKKSYAVKETRSVSLHVLHEHFYRRLNGLSI